jgi:hypothetical protein
MMKTSLFIFTLIFSASAFAGFTSNDDIVKKLSSYKVADIEGDKARLKKKEKLKIDEMFNDLRDAAKFLESNTPSEAVAFEMERTCLLTFIHDPSTFAVDLILEIYEKNIPLFKKASDNLHPRDKAVILEVLEGKLDARMNGGG